MAEVKIPGSLPWHESAAGYIEAVSSGLRIGGIGMRDERIYAIHAANHYPTLVEALKDIAAAIPIGGSPSAARRRDRARAALKAAGVEP